MIRLATEKDIEKIADRINETGYQLYLLSRKNEVIDLEILSDQIVYIYKLLNFIFEMAESIQEQNNEIIED